MEARHFDLADIVSTARDILLPNATSTDIPSLSGVLDVMSHVTGQRIGVGNATVVSSRVQDELLRQHPYIATLELPSPVSADPHQKLAELRLWISQYKAVYGDTLPVEPIKDFPEVDLLAGMKAKLRIVMAEEDR